MYARKLVATSTLCGLVLLTGTGCFFSDPLLSGAAKIVGGQMTSLNVAEVQAIYGFVTTQAGITDAPPFPDAHAEALIQFLKDNDINTIQDVRWYLEHPEAIQISDEVRALLDEETLRDILEQLQAVDFQTLL